MEDNFKAYYEQKLVPDLNSLEADRLEVIKKVMRLRRIMLSIVLPITIITGVYSWVQYGDLYLLIPVIIFIWTPGLIVYIVRRVKYAKPYEHDFKNKIMTALVRFIDDSLKYNPVEKISPEEFKSSGIFKQRLDKYRGEDLVYGKLGGTEIRFSEVNAAYKTQRRENGRTKTEYHTIFDGVFFVCDFNKHFRSRLYVFPDLMERLFGKWGQNLQELDKSHGELIKLEDPEFEKEFAIYGDDQVESRYILSTSLMQRILNFKKKTKSMIYMSFVDSKLYVAISIMEDLFEARLWKTILDYDYIKSNLDYFLLFTGIVEDLNLNRRIWTKQQAEIN